MPLETVRVEEKTARVDGQVRMVDVLMAGDHSPNSRFSFVVWFGGEADSDDVEAGEPHSVGWTVKFGEYCRDRPSWIQAVLVGPSGEVWRGFRVAVPAGPDRVQDWSTGSTGAYGPGAMATPGLLEAMAEGGRFTLALEDDEGQRWNEVLIDTLTPTQRERLFAAPSEAARATSDGLLRVVALEPFVPPASPRPCP